MNVVEISESMTRIYELYMRNVLILNKYRRRKVIRRMNQYRYDICVCYWRIHRLPVVSLTENAEMKI